MLYLVRLDNDHLKIGYSKEVDKRIKNFETSHVNVELISTRIGSVAHEAFIHRICNKYKIKNELFEDKQEVIDLFNNYEFEKELEERNDIIKRYNKSSLLQNGLQYRDVLTYGTLLSFCNKNLECWPTMATINKESKLSKTFITKSIDRLVNAGWISFDTKTNKDTKREYRIYKCASFENFKMIPLDVFKSDIKSEDLAMLLCIRQFYYDQTLTTDINIVEMAELLGIPYSTLCRRYESLKKKGYISIKTERNKALSVLENKDFEWKVTIEKKVNEINDKTNEHEQRLKRLEEIMTKQYLENKGFQENYLNLVRILQNR